MHVAQLISTITKRKQKNLVICIEYTTYSTTAREALQLEISLPCGTSCKGEAVLERLLN